MPVSFKALSSGMSDVICLVAFKGLSCTVTHLNVSVYISLGLFTLAFCLLVLCLKSSESVGCLLLHLRGWLSVIIFITITIVTILVLIFFFFLKTGSHCVALTGLELNMYTRFTHRESYICFPSAEIKGLYHTLEIVSFKITSANKDTLTSSLPIYISSVCLSSLLLQ